MAGSGFRVFIIVYLLALFLRFVGYSISYAKKNSGKISSSVFFVLFGIAAPAGLILNAIFLMHLTELLPNQVNKTIIQVFFTITIEFLILYGAMRLARLMMKVPPLSDEDKITSRYICNDGHVVKSRGEALIDNWLHGHDITHEYEGTLSLGSKKAKYDWLLVAHDIVIEYWGMMNSKEYRKRREEKEKLYKKKGTKLISITNSDLEDINKKVRRKLLTFMDENELDKPKRCFNCGQELDDRY
ncbi:hypothetical protein GF325_12655 [Candidatus Bathyarchaeota archaeon]|nr:hypothetical protein [Candidatus Bathyarchaeota archaeon]